MNEQVLGKLLSIAEQVEPVGNARLASAVVQRDNIVSIGINQKKSHPFQKEFGKNRWSIYFHAETNAIYHALKGLEVEALSQCDLYVARVKHNDDLELVPALAKPCRGCQRCINTFKLSTVYYTTRTGVHKHNV